jgi:hypothetical protein
VTLITVFPYPDGTVIAADSQETVEDCRGNQFKYSVLKLKPEKMGNFQVAIAGGGNGEAIDSFIEDCKQAFSDTKLDSLGDFKKAIQAKLKECRKDLRSVGDDNKMHLLIAAQIGQSYAVWKTRSHVLTDVTEPDMIGFTDYLYRHTMKEYQPKNLPAIQLILLSLRVLDFARQTSTCVDQPYSIVIVRKDGIHVFDDEIIKHFTHSIGIFGLAVNRLLLACGDTSMHSEVFKKHLEEFSESARHLRTEYMQEVGKLGIRRMFEGHGRDPIIVTPPRTIISMIVDEAGEQEFEMREQTAEENEQFEKMRKMALEPLPNCADGKEIRMMHCTNLPCTTDFPAILSRPEGKPPVVEGTCPDCGKEYHLQHPNLH